MRYIVLVLLNVPVIFMAFLNLTTRYKMKRIPRERYLKQLFVWLIILLILVGSFPIYNLLNSHPTFDSINLSVFDIVQTTMIIFLFYTLNHYRQKLDNNERRLRDLHQELSIKLSSK